MCAGVEKEVFADVRPLVSSVVSGEAHLTAGTLAARSHHIVRSTRRIGRIEDVAEL